jgi:hypothetical protein
VKSPQSTDKKAFLISALSIGVAVWDIAFFLGVHGTIFFEKLFAVWVAATVISLISIFWPQMIGGEILGNRGRIALALPTVWLILTVIDPSSTWIVLASGIVVALVALPYMLVIVVSVAFGGTQNRRQWAALACIAVFFGAVGYIAGLYNELLLSCWDFQVSGNQVPTHCAG